MSETDELSSWEREALVSAIEGEAIALGAPTGEYKSAFGHALHSLMRRGFILASTVRAGTQEYVRALDASELGEKLSDGTAWDVERDEWVFIDASPAGWIAFCGRVPDDYEPPPTHLIE